MAESLEQSMAVSIAKLTELMKLDPNNFEFIADRAKGMDENAFELEGIIEDLDNLLQGMCSAKDAINTAYEDWTELGSNATAAKRPELDTQFKAFETKWHSGQAVTDAEKRLALLRSAKSKLNRQMRIQKLAITQATEAANAAKAQHAHQSHGPATAQRAKEEVRHQAHQIGKCTVTDSDNRTDWRRAELKQRIDSKMENSSILNNKGDDENKKSQKAIEDHAKTMEQLPAVNCSSVGGIEQKKNAGYKDKKGKRIPLPCIFCKEKHWANECKKYCTLSARSERLKEIGRCTRCFRTGHAAAQCECPSKCFGCYGAHPLSMCPNQKIPQQLKFKQQQRGGKSPKNGQQPNEQQKWKIPAKDAIAPAELKEAVNSAKITSTKRNKYCRTKSKIGDCSPSFANSCSANSVKSATKENCAKCPKEPKLFPIAGTSMPTLQNNAMERKQKQKKICANSLLKEKFAQMNEQNLENQQKIIQLETQLKAFQSEIEEEKQKMKLEADQLRAQWLQLNNICTNIIMKNDADQKKLAKKCQKKTKNAFKQKQKQMKVKDKPNRLKAVNINKDQQMKISNENAKIGQIGFPKFGHCLTERAFPKMTRTAEIVWLMTTAIQIIWLIISSIGFPKFGESNAWTANLSKKQPLCLMSAKDKELLSKPNGSTSIDSNENFSWRRGGSRCEPELAKIGSIQEKDKKQHPGRAAMMGLGMVSILCLMALWSTPYMAVPMTPNTIGNEWSAHHISTQQWELAQNKLAIPVDQYLCCQKPTEIAVSRFCAV